jgi:hypothetical protein
MFQFIMGVAFGAAGYWAWQSFGRDLLGMGGDQDTTYGGFNSGSSGSAGMGSFGSSGSTGSGSTSGSSNPSSSSSGMSGSTT